MPTAVEIPEVAIVYDALGAPPITALSKNNVSPLLYPDPPEIIDAEVTFPPAPTTTLAVAPSHVVKKLSLYNFTL